MRQASLFTPTLTTNGGNRVRGMLATCGGCELTGAVPMNTLAGCSANDQEQSDRIAKRKFEKIGWQIGGKASQHRCPDCVRAANKQQGKDMAETKPKLEVVAEKPRVMSRDDRRIIFEKLNEVYVNENTGYSGDWTDGKVAADLGEHVPRAWVAEVRESMFGPDKSNEEMRKALGEAKAFLGHVANVRGSHERLGAELARLMPIADKVERHLANIEKALSC